MAPDATPGTRARLHRDELPCGAVRVVDVAGAAYVVWRGGDGLVRSAPRRCPHLDHDLAEGYVSGDELVCAGHAWTFDGEGRVFKRNEFGRVDPKGTVASLAVCEQGGVIELGEA
jgi:phenylpropionate dioxygenase-like ring-hydroxylating dioxygenase large terminal subunit